MAKASTGAGRYRQPRSRADPAGVAVIVGTWQAQLLLRHNTPAHCSILSRFEAGRCELGPGVGVPRIAQDLRAKQAPNMVDAGVTVAPACHTGHRRCTVLMHVRAGLAQPHTVGWRSELAAICARLVRAEQHRWSEDYARKAAGREERCLAGGVDAAGRRTRACGAVQKASHDQLYQARELSTVELGVLA